MNEKEMRSDGKAVGAKRSEKITGNAETEKSVRLRTIVYGLLVLTIVFTTLSFVGMQRVSVRYRQMLASSVDYGAARDSVDELSAGSDYLTEQVRQYVITGNRQYMDNYFYEADVRRRRDFAVETIINDMEIGEGTIEALTAALDESNRLMELEYHAMKLVSYVDGLDENTLHEKVRGWKMTNEELSMNDIELTRLAGTIVFGDEYVAAKDRINYDLDLAVAEVENRISTNMNASAAELRKTLSIQVVITVLLMLLMIVSVVILIVGVVRPLSIYDHNIKAGEPLEIKGPFEFRRLAKTYNYILKQNNERRIRLKYKAEHDELTKLLNRTAFDKLCDNLAKDETPFALIIIDVDNFKTINDNYGHVVGDASLLRVAKVLLSTFRSDDYCVRYGGDEFVVLMTGITPSSSYTITSKVEKINGVLKNSPDPNEPALSLSVGIAFSEHGYSLGLFANADKALYYTKEHGRAGYTFYDEVEMHYYET